MTNKELIETKVLDSQFPEKNQKTVFTLVKDTLISYKEKPNELSLNEWVTNEFLKYPDIYDKEKAKKDADEIIIYTTEFEKSKEEIEETIKKGNSAESYLAKKIEKSAELNHISNVGEYANSIDEAISKANENLFDTFITNSGNINQNPQLHGFVGESHHVNSFNLEAALKDSPYRAEMLQSNGKNSVDIVIKDIEGKIVRKYSAKYGLSAEKTDSYFKDANGEYKYKGQSKLVPSDQQENIKNSTSYIESPDGIKSTKLSYKEAKEIQEEIQKRKNLNEFNWDKISKKEITTHIAKQTGIIVALQGAFSGIGIMAKRFSQIRKENRVLPSFKEVQEDFKQWLNNMMVFTAVVGLKTAVTVGFTIATRKGLIPLLAKNTPAGRLAGIVYVGMENVKTIYRLGKGKISIKEAIQEMKINTLSAIGGLVGAGEGAVIGASIGTILGPAGTIAGGFVGGIIGGIVGSEAGKLIAKAHNKIFEYTIKPIQQQYEMTKSVVKAVGRGVGKTVKSVGNGLKKVGNAITSLFS